MEIGELGANALHEIVAGVGFSSAITWDELQKECGLFHAAIFVMAEQVADGIFCGQIANESGVGIYLAIRKRVFLGIAYVFNADGDAVQADAVARHPCFGHEAIDRAVAVDQELRRDVEFAFTLEFGTRGFDAGVAKVVPGSSKGRRYCVMQNDSLRGDCDVLSLGSVMFVDIVEGELDALLVEGDGLVNDVEIVGCLRGGGHDEHHGDDRAAEGERKLERCGDPFVVWR